MKTARNYRTRVDITVLKGAEELLPESFYGLLPASGLWIQETNDTTILTCYPSDTKEFLRVLKHLAIDKKNIQIVEEAAQDYAALTQKYFRPIRIEKLTVLAPWNKTGRKGPRIYIEPGMAFGTGRHESTRLMIKMMDAINIKNKEVLDIGCGSAILSLYAAVLGARKVYAVDVDRDSIDSARENIRLNDVKIVETACKDLRRIKGSYDIILANIDIKTFRATSVHIAGLLRTGGHLLVSGIVGRDKNELLSLFKDLKCIRIIQKNSWRGFLFRKLSAS